MCFKGWRTVAYNILTAVSAVLVLVMHAGWADAGFDPRVALVIVLAAKVADSLINLYLRSITNTPVGKAD